MVWSGGFGPQQFQQMPGFACGRWRQVEMDGHEEKWLGVGGVSRIHDVVGLLT
jgi:hypothetical protein